MKKNTTNTKKFYQLIISFRNNDRKLQSVPINTATRCISGKTNSRTGHQPVMGTCFKC